MWAVKGNSRSVSHYFVSDEHSRIPLLASLCGRYNSQHIDALDIHESGRKHCGDCVNRLALLEGAK